MNAATPTAYLEELDLSFMAVLDYEEWDAGHDRTGALRRFLDRAAGGNAIAFGQAPLDGIDFGFDPVDYRGRLGLSVKVAADGNGRKTIAPPDEPRFKAVLQAGDLAERDALPGAGGHRQVGQ